VKLSKPYVYLLVRNRQLENILVGGWNASFRSERGGSMIRIVNWIRNGFPSPNVVSGLGEQTRDLRPPVPPAAVKLPAHAY